MGHRQQKGRQTVPLRDRQIRIAAFLTPTTGRQKAYEREAAASNKFRNNSFFSAGRNDASKELRANSRRCSSVKPNVSCTNWYSRLRDVRNIAGSSVLRVTMMPWSK